MSGDITRLLRGKRFAYAVKNNTSLRLRTEDGSEIEIQWVDANGLPVKGEPVVRAFGPRLLAGAGVKDLLSYPNLLTKGHA